MTRRQRDPSGSTPPKPQHGPFGSTVPGGVARPPEPPTPEREPIPGRHTIDRQNQHVDRFQDGGRETGERPIDKHGGDLQRKDIERH